MTAGRKPLAVPDIVDPALDTPHLDGALAVMREGAISEETAIRADIYRLGQLVGARQMALAAAHFLRAADIQLFGEISKSKGYKHIPLQHPDGNLRPAENIEQFCRLVFKKSYSVMAESRKALEVLGEESYEIATELGLHRTQLRLLLSLPEDSRRLVEEAMQSETKSEVVALIQSLANRLDDTQAEVEHLKGEVKAKEEILAEKNVALDAERAKARRIATLPPDERHSELMKEAGGLVAEALGILQGKVRQAFLALASASPNDMAAPDSRQIMAGHVAEIQQRLNELREEFVLDDHVGDGTPRWASAFPVGADTAEG